jgi:hypothetical protein
MKTSELTGAKLNYWVAKADNVTLSRFPRRAERLILPSGEKYSPSTDWSQGGPIIHKHRIQLHPYESPELEGFWRACMISKSAGIRLYISSDDPLQSAMRCYVASKFGDEVPDE